MKKLFESIKVYLKADADLLESITYVMERWVTQGGSTIQFFTFDYIKDPTYAGTETYIGLSEKNDGIYVHLLSEGTNKNWGNEITKLEEISIEAKYKIASILLNNNWEYVLNE